MIAARGRGLGRRPPAPGLGLGSGDTIVIVAGGACGSGVSDDAAVVQNSYHAVSGSKTTTFRVAVTKAGTYSVCYFVPSKGVQRAPRYIGRAGELVVTVAASAAQAIPSTASVTAPTVRLVSPTRRRRHTVSPFLHALEGLTNFRVGR